MRNAHIKNFDSASEYIMTLQALMLKPRSLQKELELGLLQQFLDEEALYIKQMPRDHSNVFRAFADSLFWSQSQFLTVLQNYTEFLDSNYKIHELSSLLIMLTTMSTPMYVQSLKGGHKSKPEVDAILMAMFFGLDLQIYYINESRLSRHTFDFYSGPAEGRKVVRLYLGIDGGFDTVYNKPVIKSAGICQSILLDLLDTVFGTEEDRENAKRHAPIYQNVEYQTWKLEVAEIKSKGGSTTDSLKIAFGGSSAGDEGMWSVRERETPSSRRKNVSDTSVGTPTLRRQIRGYLSSESVSPIHSKFANIEPISEVRKCQVPTSVSTSARTSLKDLPKLQPRTQPDSFGSYMEAYKGPSALNKSGIAPAPGLDPYYGQYYGQAPMVAPPGMYPTPQTYFPVYVPVLLQPPTIPPIPTYPSFTTAANVAATGEILTGRVKFFDSTQNYGFFILDCNGSDLFVHYDDFLKSGITKEYIQMAKAMNVRFAFRRVNYYGKYSLSSKAVDIQIIQENYTNE